MTFRDFMQAALYDPEHGYYNTARLKIGAGGDYYTSSNVHAAFGATLARAFSELWAKLSSGTDSALTLVEIGAGTGQLACDIIEAIRTEHQSIFERLSYVIVETSPAMLDLQRRKLAEYQDRVRWQTIHESAKTPVSGIIFSNELIDALPVHLCRFDEELREAYVDAPEGLALSLVWRDASTPKLPEYLERMRLRPRRGQIIEINLDAMDWLSQVSRIIKEGFLVTIDYGDVSELLYDQDRNAGTLRSFFQHQLAASPLERVGEQDITASVNFEALMVYGCDFGFEKFSYERQTAFLIRMGLIERVAALFDSARGADDINQRLALKNLFVPGGVSENFRVLIQQRR
jgi:SAM-dependent MidA family methyltransferase